MPIKMFLRLRTLPVVFLSLALLGFPVFGNDAVYEVQTQVVEVPKTPFRGLLVSTSASDWVIPHAFQKICREVKSNFSFHGLLPLATSIVYVRKGEGARTRGWVSRGGNASEYIYAKVEPDRVFQNTAVLDVRLKIGVREILHSRVRTKAKKFLSLGAEAKNGQKYFVLTRWRKVAAPPADRALFSSQSRSLAMPLRTPQDLPAGTLLMEAQVATSGLVGKVSVLENSFPESFRGEALRAVRSWRYRPAQNEKKLPVASRQFVRIVKR